MLWSTYEKRGFLRSVKSQAKKSNQSLEEALLAIVEGRAISIIQGRINVSFSDGSTASGYVAPSGRSQSDVMALASEMMDLRDQVAATLAPNFNDDDLFTGMMAHERLTAIKGYTSNWMYLAK